MRLAAVLALAMALALAGCGSPSTPLVSASPASSVEPGAAAAVRERGAPGGPERIGAAPAPVPPSAPALAARYEAALLEDHCADRDVPAPPATDVVLTVLDRTYALAADYVPPDLVPAAEAGLAGVAGTKLVRAVLVDDLAEMREAWEAAGLQVVVESAYRAYAAQAATFDSWVARLGYAEALLRSARPGHSEHQLGTAIDVTSPGWGGRFGDWALETAEGAWMAEHAWQYGFVMSYPFGSQSETCFSYEPWHYRWIGREAAAAHRESGLQLRTFLERYVDG